MAGNSKATQYLIGVGLLIVGLLTGILIVLMVQTPAQLPAPSAPIVERVQLGTTSRAQTDAPAVDPERPELDPISLNRYFRQVAEEVTPAVVFIQVDATGSVEGGEWFHGDPESRRRFFRERFPRQSVGSGVIISPQGYIVTNNHVISGADEIQVTLADKRQYTAAIIGTDPSTDLAVIKIDAPEPLPLVEFADSDQLQVGEWVLAVGNPFRLTSTVTAGIVSALGRQVNIIDDSFRIEEFIQTDAAINPGNSGGALVDLDSRLVGINTAIATESGSYEGYGFAVPSNLMERVATDLIAYGEVRRGFLGVSIQEIDASVAKRLGLGSIGGVFVNEVRGDGAAHRAGIRSGDVVTAVAGRAVNAPNELQSAVARFRPGEIIELEVLRNGERISRRVELLGRDAPAYENWFAELNRDTRPPQLPDLEPETERRDIRSFEHFGFGVRELTNRDRRSFGINHGAYVAYVQSGSEAERAGIPRDAVITAVDGEAVFSVDDVASLTDLAVEADEPALVEVSTRAGVRGFFELRPVPW